MAGAPAPSAEKALALRYNLWYSITFQNGGVTMKLLDLNINCFGGTDAHREAFKAAYGPRYYLKAWDERDKSKEVRGILECIKRHSPDLVILQEYDIHSHEARFFERELRANGYTLHSETPESRRPSMTVFFVREATIPTHTYVSANHTRNGRAYGMKVGDIILYGTHVPPHYDEQFWTELHQFVKEHLSEKYLLMGDFNTINPKNRAQLNRLLEDAADLWRSKGHDAAISVMGDYAIASKAIDIQNVEIDSFDEGYSDHPVMLVSIQTTA